MTTLNLVMRGWEITGLGVFALTLSAAQIATGKAILPRWGKWLPDWVSGKDYPGHFIWGVVSTGALGGFSVWYGVVQVLQHLN